MPQQCDSDGGPGSCRIAVLLDAQTRPTVPAPPMTMREMIDLDRSERAMQEASSYEDVE
jgi:hypothetical protein